QWSGGLPVALVLRPLLPARSRLFPYTTLFRSADGVMILNSDLEIVSFNRALERMTAWKASDAIGLKFDDVITWKRVEKGDLRQADRKSTRLNSSHVKTSYAVFCLKKKIKLPPR